MWRLENLGATFVLRAEEDPVFQGFDESVPMVEMLNGGSGEVDDHHWLSGIGVGEVGKLAIGEYGGVMPNHEESRHKGFAGISSLIPDPIDLSRTRRLGDDVHKP